MVKEVICARYKDTDLSEKELLGEILRNFEISFSKQKATNFTGSFNCIVTCDSKVTNFVIQVKNSSFEIVSDHKESKPYLQIECSFEMFCRITLGQINPVTDILNGKIKLSRGIFSIARFAFFGALFSNRQIDLKLPTSISNPAQWIKPEKILLVNGSPRKNGSTKLMLEWFMEGLPGDNTDIVDVSSLKIGKCLNCFKCWTDHPTVCVREDDAKIFRQKINEADLIVFFVPLSYMTMPADMKAAFERLFPETTPFFYHNKPTKTSHPLHKGKKPQAFLQFLLWGFPEKRHGQFLEGVYVEWAMHSHKNYIGSLMRPGINMILGDPRMQYIRRNIRNAIKATAQSVYNTGVIPEKERKIIEREDYMSIKDFYFYATHYLMDRFKTDYWDSD